MKTKFLFIAIAFLMLNSLQAQLSFGVKGGLNAATLTGDVENAKTKIAFHIGAFAEFEISESFALQPELVYSLQGADFEGDEKNNLNYLNIPIIGKYYVTEGLSLEAGPQFGLNLSAKAESGDESFDFKKDVNGLDLGFAIGAGYGFTDNLFASLRYNLGLSNINKEGEDSIKNGVIQVSLGYKF